MKAELKMDLGDPKSIRKALASWSKRLADAQAEAEQLNREQWLLKEQALNRTELLELMTLQVDRSAAWWQRWAGPDLLKHTFVQLESGRLAGSMIADPLPEPASAAEPFVSGLFVGAAPYCYLLRDQMIAGFTRLIDAMPEVVPGPSYTDRQRTLATLVEREAELRAEIDMLERGIAAASTLADTSESSMGLLERLTAKLRS